MFFAKTHPHGPNTRWGKKMHVPPQCFDKSPQSDLYSAHMKKLIPLLLAATCLLAPACSTEEQREAGTAEIAFDKSSGENAAQAFEAMKKIFGDAKLDAAVAARLSQSDRAKAGDPKASRTLEADADALSFKIGYKNPSANLSEKIADLYAAEALNFDVQRINENDEKEIYQMRKEIEALAKRNMGIMENVLQAKKAVDGAESQKQAKKLEDEYTASSDALADKVSALEAHIKKLSERGLKSPFVQTKFASASKRN